jgi:hypothetical protein
MKKNQNKWQGKSKTADPFLNSKNIGLKDQAPAEVESTQNAPAKYISGLWVLLVFVVLIVAVFLLGWLTK